MNCSKCKKDAKLINMDYARYYYEGDAFNDISGSLCIECYIKKYGPKKLYHVSLDPDVYTLIPRIPDSVSEKQGEDKTSKRVCLSSSIEGALSSVAWGGINFETLMSEYESPAIRVLEFKVEAIGVENLVPPDYLWQHDLVRDAIITDEWWATSVIRPSDAYFISISDYEEEPADLFTFTDFKQFCDDMVDFEDIMDGGISTFTHLEYRNFKSRRKLTHSVNVDLILTPTLEDKDMDSHINSIENDLCLIYPDGEFMGEIREEDGRIIVSGYLDMGPFYYNGEYVEESIIKSLSTWYNVEKIMEEINIAI